jgi:hypothetical protein
MLEAEKLLGIVSGFARQETTVEITSIAFRTVFWQMSKVYWKERRKRVFL